MFRFFKRHRYEFTFGRGSFWVIEAKDESTAVQRFLYEHPFNDGNFKIEEVE